MRAPPSLGAMLRRRDSPHWRRRVRGRAFPRGGGACCECAPAQGPPDHFAPHACHVFIVTVSPSCVALKNVLMSAHPAPAAPSLPSLHPSHRPLPLPGAPPTAFAPPAPRQAGRTRGAAGQHPALDLSPSLLSGSGAPSPAPAPLLHTCCRIVRVRPSGVHPGSPVHRPAPPRRRRRRQ
ncbi:MAG: hypothetical protein J3K34DRAFT_432953 [Monoraphidium minutum]|nr:MAG: hypothetical protein J3K34DRAFT_432953 [Monoraphidium minutum]